MTVAFAEKTLTPPLLFGNPKQYDFDSAPRDVLEAVGQLLRRDAGEKPDRRQLVFEKLYETA